MSMLMVVVEMELSSLLSVVALGVCFVRSLLLMVLMLLGPVLPSL